MRNDLGGRATQATRFLGHFVVVFCSLLLGYLIGDTLGLIAGDGRPSPAAWVILFACGLVGCGIGWYLLGRKKGGRL
jgi:membrane protein DedA with SNARE-associated domain